MAHAAARFFAFGGGHQQSRRWLDAGVFDTLTDDLRALLRQVHGRDTEPRACVLDSRTLQSTPESGARAGYDASKRRRGTKVHLAVDTLGHPLAVHVSGADEQDRTHVAPLLEKVQDVTGGNVELAYADQGYTGEDAAQAVAGRLGRVSQRRRAAARVLRHVGCESNTAPTDYESPAA
jgi:transposase